MHELTEVLHLGRLRAVEHHDAGPSFGCERAGAGGIEQPAHWVLCQRITRDGTTRPRSTCPATASARGASSMRSTASRP